MVLPPRYLDTIPSNYDTKNIVPVDIQHKFYPQWWPDVKGCSEPDWLEKQGYAVDNDLWWSQWKQSVIFKDKGPAASVNPEAANIATS